MRSRRKLIPTVSEKLCKRCNVVKPAKAFGVSSARHTFLQDWCKECSRAQSKARYNANGWRRTQAWNTARRLRHYDLVTDYLRAHPCMTCGEADPIVLEFDHRDPTKKRTDISKMAGKCSWKKIMREINKCNVLCVNCHRKITARQKGWRRWKQQEELDMQNTTVEISNELS